ncbi:MAG: glycosyltransferase family 4 protein [Terriglobales bacterium]|jgi:glycosyltransferase involved in cell wall biosynthesis
MRVIVVTPAVPHPFGDSSARWFYVLITELLARGNEVVVVAATEESAARVAEAKQWLNKQAGRLTLHCHRLQMDSFALRRKWCSLVRPRSELLQDRTLAMLLQRELARGYDVLHLEQMSTGWLGLGKRRALLNLLSLDSLDWAARPRPSLYDRHTLWQAERATHHLLREIDNIRVLSSRLKEAAESIHPMGRYWIVPLALDTSLYELQPPVDDLRVGLTGSMHWEPSRSAAERLLTRIWPIIKKLIPRAKLYIAGWNATKYLGQFIPQADVTLADNIRHPSEFFSKVGVLLYAPVRGSGMKVKVMESMAYGVPVVTTWEGVEGMSYKDGYHCWVAESDEALARRACRLLENPAERKDMRAAARQLIEDRYSPRPVVDQMTAVYEELVSA